jgi:outer membrane beta-barrel protein
MRDQRVRRIERFACVALALAASCLVSALGERRAHAQCVDEELKQELVGGRHYRGVEERLFTKAFRHEITAMGGYYSADLYSSTWVVGGAYTFHFSEDLALEASYQRSQFHSAITDSYERRYPEIQVEGSTTRDANLYFGHLLWTFAYGKLRWMGGGISRFDFNFALGAGVTDDSTSQGLTASAGFGTKFFFGKWFALRADLRDHLLRENLVGDDHIVNDLIFTLGVSVFIPFGG